MTHPILLHIPHSSPVLPKRWRDIFLLSEEELQRELIVMTDAYAEELFELTGRADRLVFPVSRLLVDVERYHEDRDEPMAEKGMGAIPANTHDGRPLKLVDQRAALMEEYYIPHREALDQWTAESLAKDWRCLILNCQTFPSQPMACDVNQKSERPDVCLGTSKLHSEKDVLMAAVEAFEKRGWSVLIDVPYYGTIVPIPFFGRDRRVASIKIDVNRQLYMDEATGDKSPCFDQVKATLQECLGELASHWMSNFS